MKKLLFVAAITLVSFASCKKDHSCTCKIDAGGGLALSNTKVYENTSKKDALDACKKDMNPDNDSDITCELN